MVGACGRGVTESARARAVERIARLVSQPHDVVSLWREASPIIAKAVPHFWTPCWYTLDPESLLITSHHHEGLAEFPAEWLADEYYGDDVNRLTDVTRSPRGIRTLHEATGGNPRISPRWWRNMTVGSDQELIAILRGRSGHVWGGLGLYREPGQPMFDDLDLRFVQAVVPHLADGIRRALLVGQATDPDGPGGPDAPGLLVLTDRWEVESTTPGAEHWLAVLPDGDWSGGRLPSAVLSLAGQALAGGQEAGKAGHHPGDVAVARVRTKTGTWVVLHAAPLSGSGCRRAAVIIEPANPARINPLLMAAYGLTERERDVTRLVLQGHSTSQIAARLTISALTVQDHLKNVFNKTGVRSRRELIATVFYRHYEPRLRDNERRVLRGQPTLSGPVEPDRATPPH